jgi:hypothetical protein
MDTPVIIGTGFGILAIVVWIVCWIGCYQRAPERGRSARNWGILGIFGPFALFALYLLPKGHTVTHHEKAADPRDELYEVHRKR